MREAGAESALASRSSSPEWLLQIAREYDRKGYLQETAGAYDAAITAATIAGDAPGGRGRAAASRGRALPTAGERRGPGAVRAGARRWRGRRATTGSSPRHSIPPAASTCSTSGSARRAPSSARRRRSPPTRICSAASSRTSPRSPAPRATTPRRSTATSARSRDSSAPGTSRAAPSPTTTSASSASTSGDGPTPTTTSASASRRVNLTGDLHLRGQAVMNHAEALIGLGRLREARVAAETAASIFDELHAPLELADAYRVLGAVFRQNGRARHRPDAAASRHRGRVDIPLCPERSRGDARARARACGARPDGRGGGDDGPGRGRPGAAQARRARRPPAAPATIRRASVPGATCWRCWTRRPRAAPSAWREAAAEAARRQGLGDEAQACIRVAGYLHALDPAWISDGMLPWNIRPILCGLRGGRPTAESEIIARELDRNPRAA